MRLLPILVFLIATSTATAAERPNILWLTSEDHGPHMGCYGDALARTPHVDALALRGLRFTRAWSCVPVCAPARTAIITGMYPSSTGALHMRSMVPLPPHIKLFPQIMRTAGYYCTNNSKTDYNVPMPRDTWNESSGKAHWRKRNAGQPFFAVFNSTRSHESQIRKRPHAAITDPADVRVPAHHPDLPEVRQDWAQYYDQVSKADADAGQHLQELADAGLANDTIVFYFADHGSGMPRHKRWPGNSGLHVPMVVYFPEKWKHLAPPEYAANGQSDRLVNFVDLAPTVLSLAGIEPPAYMQGRAFAGKYIAEAPKYLFGQRGRMDERTDIVRSVTDGRFVYLRNFLPHVSTGQHVNYQFETPTTRVWFEHFTKGKTNAAQSQFWQTPRSPEELYDLQADRDEVQNLAADPQHQAKLAELRAALRQHLLEVRDVCLLPEGEMHRRAQGRTPYELARNDERYPLQRILAAAELASSLADDTAPQLLTMLQDDDSAVRYWAAMGLLMRGDKVVAANQAALLPLLKDAKPAVCVAAAHALVKYGDETSRTAALEALSRLLPPQTQDFFAAMDVLETVDNLGWQAVSLHPKLPAIKQITPPDGRFAPDVAKLLKHLTVQPRRQPNVLFIAIDDLNDWVEPLGGHPLVKTPQLNRLAARGTTFTNAHCQAPICNPSRCSIMLGIRPTTTGIYGLAPWLRSVTEAKDRVTLPQHFRANGYRTLTCGKIYHAVTGGREAQAREFDVWGPGASSKPNPPQKLIPPTPHGNHPLMDWGVFPHQDEDKGDFHVASWAVSQLQSMPQDQPFFLAVGFFLPHVPCYVTQKWWDLYADAGDRLLPPLMPGDRDDTPRFSWYLHWTLPEPRLSWMRQHNQLHNLAQAYLASTSFVDSQVGRLLDALDETDLADNTVVVLWSDHGWHLGEKEITGKNSLWERSTRVPLIFAGPGVAKSAKCAQPAELLDVYPTLIDLCDLPRRDDLEGHSLAPQLRDAGTPREWPAITSHNQGNHAVRSEHWRYIRYADGSEELYDMKQDPHEWHNLVASAAHAATLQEHRRWLPKTDLPPAPGSKHRVLTYNAATDEATWEGHKIGHDEPIPQ